MKVLSVVVPMFNTELYIERCLDSLLFCEEIIDDLEIIVVNDGSTDFSLNIAKEYRDKYPNSVFVVNKENGGHGSAVNAGLKKASGKYIRIVDSDDWVDIDNFKEYVNRLKKENADVVVTNVRRQHLYDETELDFVFGEKSKKPIPIDKVTDKIKEKDFFFEFSMHSMTVKLNKLREVWGEGLLEKTFYVDQQFVAKVFMCASDYIEYDINIYMYFIGRPEQSMGEGFFKHIKDHERVLRWLLDTVSDKKMPSYYRVVVSRQIELMLKTHYTAYAEQSKLMKKDKLDLKRFDNYLKQKYPIYYKNSSVGRIIKDMSVVKNNKIGKIMKYYKKGGK